MATIGRARDIASARLALLNTPIFVYIHAGRYLIPDPIIFSVANSGTVANPITYSNAPGEAAPELIGALTFQGGSTGQWSETTLDTVAGPYPGAKVYQFTDASAVALLKRKISQTKANSNNGAFAITQVFRNTNRLIRSRYPANDMDADLMYMHDSQYCDHGVAAASVQSYVMLPKAIVEATSVSNGSTELVFSDLWTQPRALITGWNHATDSMDGVSLNFAAAQATVACWGGYEMEKAHFENNIHFLTTAEQWFFDETALKLYYIASPTSNTATDEFEIPLNNVLFQMSGSANEPVHDLHFTGLIFHYTNWRYHSQVDGSSTSYGMGQAAYGLSGALDGQYVDRIQVTSCRFEHTGENGISFGGTRYGNHRADGQATNIDLEQNFFSDLGGAGIRIDSYMNGVENNTVYANTVSYPGRVFEDAVGILLWVTHGSKVINNTVSFAPYSGISVGANGVRNTTADKTIIQGNVVDSTMMRMRDGGGIYVSSPQGLISQNRITNSGTIRASDAPVGPSSAVFDIYLDDYSIWWRVTDNAISSANSKSTYNQFTNNTVATIYQNDGAQNNCSTADGTPVSTAPTWW